jgi:hypothetical protein
VAVQPGDSRVQGISKMFYDMRVQPHIDGYEPPQMRSHEHVMLSSMCLWQLGISCGHHADCTTIVRRDLLLPVMASIAALRHLAHLRARSTQSKPWVALLAATLERFSTFQHPFNPSHACFRPSPTNLAVKQLGIPKYPKVSLLKT